MQDITNIDRASWGFAAISAYRQQTPDTPERAQAIIGAYCQAKEGNPKPYDDVNDVIADMLTDVLHGLSLEQLPQVVQERVVTTSELDLTVYADITQLCLPTLGENSYDAADLARISTSHFLEEQEEYLSGD